MKMKCKEMFRIQPKGGVDTLVVYRLRDGSYLSVECAKWKWQFYTSDRQPRRYLGMRHYYQLVDAEPVRVAQAEMGRQGAAHLTWRGILDDGRSSELFQPGQLKPYTLAGLIKIVAAALEGK